MAISLLMLGRRVGVREPLFAGMANGVVAAHGYRPGGAHKTASAGIAMMIAGGVGIGLVAALAMPDLIAKMPKHIETLWVTAIEVPPPPMDDTRTPPPETKITVVRETPLLPSNDNDVTVSDFPAADLPTGPMTGVLGGTGPIDIIIPDPPRPEPLWRAARRDPSRLADFQPDYPAAARREGREGVCSVSVTIQPNGRISGVRPVNCPDADFYRATERRALSRWRFDPATRDGIAVESTRTENVRFEISDALR
jgi:periplasmic protein TonB